MGDDRSIRDLVHSVVHDRWRDGDEDEVYAAFLDCAGEFRRFGLPAVEAARQLFLEGTARERDGAADLLGRLVLDAPQPVRDACFVALVELLNVEQLGANDPDVIAAIGYSFGHLDDERAVAYLLPLASHPSEEVRLAAASALPNAMCWQIHNPYPDGLATLIRLSADVDDDVRDWATFGLGQIGADSQDVRAALVARIDDQHEDTRAEAFAALAKLRDVRVVTPLLAALERDNIGSLDVEAAGELADPRFFSALTQIATWWKDDDSWKLERALRRCDPSLRATAPAIEQRLAEIVTNSLTAGASVVAISIVGSYPDTKLSIVLDDTPALDWSIWEDTDPASLDPDDFAAVVINQALQEAGQE